VPPEPVNQFRQQMNKFLLSRLTDDSDASHAVSVYRMTVGE
jgi:hypothetical protein